MPRKAPVVGAVVAVAVGAAVAVTVGHRRRAIAPATTTVATTAPATRPARAKRPTYASYLDAVRAGTPTVAATQPLGTPVDLVDAAHVVVRDPLLVDQVGNLWITRPDGQPTAAALAAMAKSPPDGSEFVVRDRPVFVHWYADGGPMLAGLVVAADGRVGGGGGFDWVTVTGRVHLCGDRPYRWSAGYTVPALGKFVVPTDVGVSVFDVTPTVAEHYHELPGCRAGATTPPVTLPDSRGILAFAPWDGGRPGSDRVSRFVDGQWSDLPADQWPPRPMLLSVLLDGSVLRIAAAPTPQAGDVESLDGPATAPAVAAGPTDRVAVSIGHLDAVALDDDRLQTLINQLSDPDPDRRRSAYDELARSGPAVAPALERAAAQQPPEGQMRLRQLLRGQLTPALGGLPLIEDRLTVARRMADGTLVLFAPAGVRVPSDRGGGGAFDETVVPAWLVVRPTGQVERPLPPQLVVDQRPDACTLRPAGDEWLVLDAAGPRRFFGNALVPLLPPAERRFTDFVALAARHRWVFRDPKTGETLLVDPTIADPTPRLPTWTIPVRGGAVGWDNAGNPVVQRGAPPGPNRPPAAVVRNRFALGPGGWMGNGPDDGFHTEVPPAPPMPTSRPTTGPSTAPVDGPPLLTTTDGTRYHDGRDALVVVDPAGHRTRWPLPAVATGAAEVDPVLVRTDDGLLFLYNAPGRLLRLRPTPTDAEPFRLEATFTDGIPNDPAPARVWLDPSGRLCFATEGPTLTVTFPVGRVPKAIANMMPAEGR